MLRRPFAVACAAATLLAAEAMAGEPMVLEGTVTWSGDRVLETSVTVPAGATLILLPGTRVTVTGDEASLFVEGSLYASGTADAPVVLRGRTDADPSIIEANSPAAVVRLHRVEVSGARNAVTVRGGFLGVTSSRFHGNETALTLDLKGHGELRDVVLEDNHVGLAVGNSARARASGLTFTGNRVALGAHNAARVDLARSVFRNNRAAFVQHNQCDVRIDGCTFEGNQVAADLSQTRRSPIFSFSTFRKNQVGISAAHFTHPLVDACTFQENEVAFSAEQFSGPLLRYCAFEKNGQAVRLDKKGNARIEGNLFRDNEVALFADFSSYPDATGNLFVGNHWHVRLGVQQSADFERRLGSRGIMLGTARDAGTRNPFLIEGQVPPGEGVFSVAGNAWDPETLAEMAPGPEENLSRFWDGRDQEPVRYEGFGDDTYAVDRIVYTPPAPAPLPVGPPAWLPLRQDSGEAPPQEPGPPPGVERSRPEQ
ncbi:MAG: right-handed parallel beta-helix repeat-containing protein [Thermodesulfobacteriota bacterium]